MKVTIAIEFEMEDGQPEGAARASLLRGLGLLRQGIERGMTGAPTGVKRGSVTVEIVGEQDISDVEDYPPDDHWSMFEGHSQKPIKATLKQLVHEIAVGLDYQWRIDRADREQIARDIKEQLIWLAETSSFRQSVEAELGLGGIGADES
jgi:hypothetical protein